MLDIPMVDDKYHSLVFSFLMSLFMSCIMSLVISISNIGFVGDIVSIWLGTWLFSFMVAFPTVVIVSPLAHKFVGSILKG